ncbi:MAG: hypothetical protein L6R42_000413 [Xanthoria sp. 1 TBL-2021]|nr:MAG: hypothetical protein L6R42_000413 [Xanthoria sp. 1 TBL-2021]
MAEVAEHNIPSDASSITSPKAQQIPPLVSPAGEPRSTDFLKPDSPRKRRRSGESPEPVPISPKFSVSPPTLSAAQALIDQRKQGQAQGTILGRETSPNPAVAVISALQGRRMVSEKNREHVSSSPSGAMGTSEPSAAAATSVQKPEASRAETAQMQRSLTPSSGLVPGEEGQASTMIEGSGVSVASPARIEESMGNNEGIPADRDVHQPRRQETDPGEGRSDKALTYPGPLPNFPQSDRRRNTHAGFGRESPSKSPGSNKKHQCPYCSTTFTRHHNLKSHLLTHSHEKPYYCDACDSRFRRLHDLKRHSKLHTGERPHTCSKCHRSFARGDALARHSKGAGGCAGRRSSLGGDDPEQEESMHGIDPGLALRLCLDNADGVSGLVYTGEASHEPEKMDEETDAGTSRKGSLPSIQRHEAPNYSGSDGHTSYAARQPSTYPPIVGRQPNPGGLYPPMASPGAGSSTSNSPRQTTFSQSSGGSTFPSLPTQNVFAQGGGMTESPKPLSPGSHQLGHPEPSIHRNRSPSLTQQYQQQQFGRKPSMQNTSSAMSLPPMPPAGHSGAPHLPSLPGLPPPDLRFTLHSQAGGPPPVHPSAQGSGPAATSPSYQSPSGNNSLSSQSGDGSQKLYGSEQTQIFAYIRSLEVKIDRLQEEVSTLKSQLSASR